MERQLDYIVLKSIKTAVHRSKDGILEEDLIKKCRDKDIGIKAMFSALKELLAEGTITLDRTSTKKRTRFLYKPYVNPPTNDIPIPEGIRQEKEECVRRHRSYKLTTRIMHSISWGSE